METKTCLPLSHYLQLSHHGKKIREQCLIPKLGASFPQCPSPKAVTQHARAHTLLRHTRVATFNDDAVTEPAVKSWKGTTFNAFQDTETGVGGTNIRTLIRTHPLPCVGMDPPIVEVVSFCVGLTFGNIMGLTIFAVMGLYDWGKWKIYCSPKYVFGILLWMGVISGGSEWVFYWGYNWQVGFRDMQESGKCSWVFFSPTSLLLFEIPDFLGIFGLYEIESQSARSNSRTILWMTRLFFHFFPSITDKRIISIYANSSLFFPYKWQNRF